MENRALLFCLLAFAVAFSIHAASIGKAVPDCPTNDVNSEVVFFPDLTNCSYASFNYDQYQIALNVFFCILTGTTTCARGVLPF